MSRDDRLRPGPRAVASFFALIPAFTAGLAVLALTSAEGSAKPEELPAPPMAQVQEAAPQSSSKARRFVTGVPPSQPLKIEPLEERPAKPVAISIPSAGIEGKIVEVGAADDGIRVPQPARVGWYRRGPRPGEVGRAIVIGHLDSVDGPAAFTTLATADQGSDVAITDGDGKRHVYEVTGMLDIAKSSFPADRVYGSKGRAELVLITCGGAFDAETGYEDNLIVFATESQARSKTSR